MFKKYSTWRGRQIMNCEIKELDMAFGGAGSKAFRTKMKLNKTCSIMQAYTNSELYNETG